MKGEARNQRPVVQPRNYFKRLTKVGCDFHRLFFRWYQESRRLFAIEFHIVSRSQHYIEFEFPGVNHVILGSIDSYEIEVHVIKDEEHLDIIATFPCFITRVSDGYIDDLLSPEYQFTAPEKETLCRIVSFERVLNWVNEDLVKARWIEIIVWPGRGNVAKLIKDDAPELKWVSDRYRVIQTLEGGGYVMQTKEPETSQHFDDTILGILPCRNKNASTRSISLLG